MRTMPCADLRVSLGLPRPCDRELSFVRAVQPPFQFGRGDLGDGRDIVIAPDRRRGPPN